MDVGAFRKFIAKKRESVKASEKEQLQILLLRTRLEREQYEFAEVRQATRKKIRADLAAEFVAVAQLLRTELYKMRNEVALTAEGRTAREIYRILTDRENAAFDAVCRELEKRTGANVAEKETRPASNVVAFNGQKAAENVELVGREKNSTGRRGRRMYSRVMLPLNRHGRRGHPRRPCG